MRIGRLQINWNKKPKKVNRQLELIHFYTFKDGTNCYTYKIEDLARVSGRYLDQTKNTLNFMLQYAAGPEQVRAFATNIQNKLLEAIEEPSPKVRLDKVIEAREISKQMPRLQDYVEDLHKKQWMDLVQMFTIIDGEEECYFSPKHNARKVALLNNESDEIQELFFSLADSITQLFSSTYRDDLVASMVKEKDLANLAASLTLLTTKQDTLSKSADGQESQSKSSET